ncbi:MAG: glycyl radical enzyme [Desulfosporosinus sp. BRH_c37]|nr:MAG: glycyl radical enzyme [Desulfosporosinus sp. BRH_c37]
MATRHQPIEYKGKVIEFPFDNPAEENIPDSEVHEHLANPTTERTKRLKARCRWKHSAGGEFVEGDVKAGIERMRLITEAYKKDTGKPHVIRRANLLSNLLNNCTVIVQEDELIVGFNAENPNYVPLYPEQSYMACMDYILDPKIAPQPVEEAKELAEFWIEHSLQKKCETYFTQHELEVMYSMSTLETPGFATGFNSVVPPYETVTEDGLLKRIELAEQHITVAKEVLGSENWNAPERLKLLPQIDIWQSMIIASKAAIAWARRHGRLCRIIAENFETNPKRKEELLKMAEICHRIPAEPCQGLWDGMQAKWFTFLICHALERYSSGFAHKSDKLLWPLYKASVIDKTFQAMSHEDAVELFECERLKVSENAPGKSRGYREVFPGSNDLFIFTLGGLNRDGSDGCNDCTDAILEAARNIRTTEPSIVFRWNPKGRLKTKNLVFQCVRDGLGYPSIKHDIIGTQQMMYFAQFSQNGNGATIEEAHDWANVLCMSPGLVGRRKTQKSRSEGGGSIFPAKIMEVTLNNGYDWSFTGMQSGLQTGDIESFTTFEEFWEAFRKQYRWGMDLMIRAKDVSRYWETKILENPFISAIDDGCMELGRECMELSEQPNGWHNPITTIVAANSMIAIKKLIFDDKKYTFAELKKALHSNWEGFEEMRKDFYNAPKWGNDDPYADEIVKAFYEDIISGEMRKITNYSGGPVLPTGQAIGLYMEIGSRTGPTPDGRYGGEACDDGGISPYMGTDKKGPTAVLRSVSKVNAATQKANLLNQRLSAPIMRSSKGFKIWLAYMNTWHDLNIDHIQFNVVSNEEMAAAQKEPEKHGDLIVRVAGFSARFVDLSTYAQNTIMARHEQDFMPEDFDNLGLDL